MKLTTINANAVNESLRFDSRFFFDRASLRNVLSGKWPLVTVRTVFGANNLLLPNIFERVPATSEEFGKRILVPYDCFRYMPYSNDILSKSQVAIFPNLEIRRGWLLIVCSGRNLGPVVFVDKFIEQFVLSHDMIRICAPMSDDLFYFAAIMHTKTGQSLVRSDRNGSVIDHLDNSQVGALQYPVVGDALRLRCTNAFRKSFALREQARLSLGALADQFLKHVGLSDWEARLKPKDKARRFTVFRKSLIDRIDGEPRAPCYAAYRTMIDECGHGHIMSAIANVFKPVGRYKTLYVEDETFGVKLLSGRQIAQFRTIGLKIMSKQAWKNPDEYLLQKGMILLTSDGRAEENLADCAMVGADRAGWTASGHVHRLIARDGIHPGLLYLACSCVLVQKLLKSLATGSVIDALSVPDVNSVTVPYPNTAEGKRMGDQAVEAWDQFAKAAELEDGVVAELEKELSA